MKKYKILDLFSGLGGFSLGLERTGHFETVAFCDNNQYSKLVIDKHWKGIKIYDDIREITKERLETDGIEFPDIITGGFPCQPFSVAGKQKGTSDDRHLWPEMFRIIKAFKPRFIIGENVRGLINIQDGVVFETVCTDLESEGYEVQPFIIPAAGVGAPHRRERVWIIANREESMVNSDNIRFQQHSTTKEESSGRGTSATSESTSNVSNTESERTRQNDERLWQRSSRISGGEGTSRSESPQSNVVNTIGNDERQEISRSNGETREIQEEYRTEHSTTGQSSRTSAIRNGDNGYEKRINVADTNDEGVRTRIGGSDNDHETESRSWRADGKGSSSDDERHNSTSTENEGMDVADTTSSRPPSESIGDIGSMGEESSREERGRNQSSIRTSTRSSESPQQKLANTNGERLEGFGQSSRQFSQKFFASDNSEGQQGSVDQGWWSVEPNVGRVAHGVPGRIHRLKGLGNSIVPQIVEEIGYAIIKAERTD